MKQEALVLFPHIQLTCVALVLFFSSFVSVLVYAMHKQNKPFFEHVALLPLEED